MMAEINSPQIPTSEDEGESEPINKRRKTSGDPYSDDEEPVVQEKLEPERPPPPKKPKIPVSLSLVSYGLEEDDEDSMVMHDTEDSVGITMRPVGLVDAEPESDDSELDDEERHDDIVPLDSGSFPAEPLTILSTDHQKPAVSFNVQSENQRVPERVEEVQLKVEPIVDDVKEVGLSWDERSKDIKLPQEPAGHCTMELQEKVERAVRRMRLDIGYDPNRSIQDNKSFRNPSIYEKLIFFLNIDEKGTNLPQEVYNPYRWTSQSFYDELARVQVREIDRLMKLQRERRQEATAAANASTTNTGTGAPNHGPPRSSSTGSLLSGQHIGGGSVSSGFVEPKKRSKWDTGIPPSAAQSTGTAQLPTTGLDPPSKLIPAVGSLVKRK